MTTEQLLDVLEPILRQYLQGDKPDAPSVVVRSPEGILVLQRENYGKHLIVQVNDAEIIVS